MFLFNKTSLVFCSLRSQNTLSPKGKARMIRFIYGTAPRRPVLLFLLFACLKTEKQKNKKSPLNKGRLFGFSDFKLRAVDFYSAFYYRQVEIESVVEFAVYLYRNGLVEL